MITASNATPIESQFRGGGVSLCLQNVCRIETQSNGYSCNCSSWTSPRYSHLSAPLLGVTRCCSALSVAWHRSALIDINRRCAACCSASLALVLAVALRRASFSIAWRHCLAPRGGAWRCPALRVVRPRRVWSWRDWTLSFSPFASSMTSDTG